MTHISSNIPEARRLLTKALGSPNPKRYVRKALTLMTRATPKFRARPTIPPLTAAQKKRAIKLRRHRIDLNTIARKLGTQHGRISEVVNGKRR